MSPTNRSTHQGGPAAARGRRQGRCRGGGSGGEQHFKTLKTRLELIHHHWVVGNPLNPEHGAWASPPPIPSTWGLIHPPPAGEEDQVGPAARPGTEGGLWCHLGQDGPGYQVSFNFPGFGYFGWSRQDRLLQNHLSNRPVDREIITIIILNERLLQGNHDWDENDNASSLLLRADEIKFEFQT